MAYNTSHTRHKSNVLTDQDCRTTGLIRPVSNTDEYAINATFTVVEAMEAGDCVGMVRVPRGFTVTDVCLTFTGNAADAVVGVGDPYCCGRFLGPLLMNKGSGEPGTTAPQGTTCSGIWRLSKIGRTGDGCGFGYTYTCEMDIVITNGYGVQNFGVGGGGPTASSPAGAYGGSISAGAVFGLRVAGYINPTFTSPS